MEGELKVATAHRFPCLNTRNWTPGTSALNGFPGSSKNVESCEIGWVIVSNSCGRKKRKKKKEKKKSDLAGH